MRSLLFSSGFALLLALSGCASAPKPAAPEATAEQASAPRQTSLAEWMAQAEQAAREGRKAQSREALRGAAQAHPTAAPPWLRLAEDYFESQDYGNAILAAQEVLQREPAERLAHSILAVSGLRVASQSLGALRQSGGLNGNARDDAVALSKSLRESLGEPILVPVRPAEGKAAEAPREAARPQTKTVARPVLRRPGPSTAGTVAQSAGTATPAAPPPPSPAAAAPAANPFNRLK